MPAKIVPQPKAAEPPPSSQGLPRTVEVALAGAAALLALPILGIASLAIKCTSPGPVLFRQKRVGREGKLFMLYKLRTMRCSGKEGIQVTGADDDRITAVGRLLRKMKLDEVPQLWNIVKGDMSFVGPRPEVPRYVDLDRLEWQLILKMRPGITDPMTLRLRNEEELLAKIDADREAFYLSTLQPYKLQGYLNYSRQRSWKKDVMVIFATVLAVMRLNNLKQMTFGEMLSHAAEAEHKPLTSDTV